MSRLRLRAVLPAGAVLVSLAVPALSQAASPPGVATRSAVGVGQSVAIVRGTISPRGVPATSAFEYGPTKAYGLATPITPAGKGTTTRPIAARVSGLAPATTYHFRVVGSNASGTRLSGDRTFKTAKQPLGLTLFATPNPVPFGQPSVLNGTLAGTDNAGKQVLLEQNPFPFTAGFTAVGNPQVTNGSGSFAFPILGLTQTTQYRVRVPGRPVASPIVTALVSVTVRTAVSTKRVKRGRSVRFAGSITPVRDGAQVAIQKERNGRWITIGGTVARHYRSDRSRYAVRVKLFRGGNLRVFVGTNSGDIANNVGSTVRIHTYR